jgi:hypothetical protein
VKRIESVVIEPERQTLYNRLGEAFFSDGVDVSTFFGNSSYFGRSPRGRRRPHRGRHPTLVHWPLGDYAGGESLLRSLSKRVADLVDLTDNDTTALVVKDYWHSTVFSPVHSSDSDVIASTNTDIGDTVQFHVTNTRAYYIEFTRIAVTTTGSILALGYASSIELERLRAALKVAVPNGVASPMIHITLGQLLRSPTESSYRALRSYLSEFSRDEIRLGRIDVEFLTYAEYIAPFLKMRLREISRCNLRQ